MSHSPWAAMRSLTRDGEVAKRKLAPGTIPRITGFAKPYKRQITIFLVLVVLMQRAKTDGGIGAAMGGGSMESTFGAETNNVLSGATLALSTNGNPNA